jgi:hypothetical protein
MGCNICKGSANQYCNAPGCLDKLQNPSLLKDLGILEDISDAAGGWCKIVRHPLRCDLCQKVAIYAHPKGGLRCEGCPRPAK